MNSIISIFIITLIWILILVSCNKLDIGRRKSCVNCDNCCPDCTKSLNRIRRKKMDNFLNDISFRLFDFKRYLCSNCGWEGIRWAK